VKKFHVLFKMQDVLFGGLKATGSSLAWRGPETKYNAISYQKSFILFSTGTFSQF